MEISKRWMPHEMRSALPEVMRWLLGQVTPARKVGNEVLSLHQAAFRGDAAGIAAQLDRGADVNGLDDDGTTPLFAATSRGSNDIGATLILLARGADPNIGNGLGRTPLHNAAAKSRADLCELLLAYGANPNAATRAGDMEGDFEDNERNALTPLHWAARLGALDVCEVLVAGGASASWVQEGNSYEGYMTPFQLVVRTGPLASVKYFAEQCNEDVRQHTFSGRSMAELAIEGSPSHAYIMAVLTEHAMERAFDLPSAGDNATSRLGRISDPL
jgi:ankyrin repeat protein